MLLVEQARELAEVVFHDRLIARGGLHIGSAHCRHSPIQIAVGSSEREDLSESRPQAWGGSRDQCRLLGWGRDP